MNQSKKQSDNKKAEHQKKANQNQNLKRIGAPKYTQVLLENEEQQAFINEVMTKYKAVRGGVKRDSLLAAYELLNTDLDRKIKKSK